LKSILSQTKDWNDLSLVVRKELRNRECFSPSVSVYRWWARRSHSLIGQLLDHAIHLHGPDITISDPMSGGGTVAIEAARRGLSVFAQDINPWAALGLETLLRPVNVGKLEVAADSLISALILQGSDLYDHPRRPDTEIICQLHVRRTQCPSCKKNNFLFPTRVLALDRRPSSKPTLAWYGCEACGEITEADSAKPPMQCGHCGQSFRGDPNVPRIHSFSINCAHCKEKIFLSPQLLRQSKFVPALAQIQLEGSNTFVAGVTKGTRLLPKSHLGQELNKPIAAGRETGALKRMGFQKWRDLYPERQLRVIEAALNLIPKVTDDRDIAQRLKLCIAGFGEMAGYAARWDPRYRKVYELTANHHYSRVYLAAEINPLSILGRGTLPKRIRQTVKAAKWFSGSSRASVFYGSSEKQPLANDSVDIVITDPPYFDSVQYGELSRVFLEFGQACGLPIANCDLRKEAVPNSYLGRGETEYRNILSGILKETARTLKSDGKLLLTFHDKRMIAWESLAEAIKESRMLITGIAVVHSENEKDHSKRGKNSMTNDVILECAKNESAKSPQVRIYSKATSNIEKNLIAIGSAISMHVKGGKSKSFSSLFNSKLNALDGTALIK